MGSWGHSQEHTHRCTMQHALCPETHKDARHRGSHSDTKGSHTHTDKYSSRCKWIYSHRHTWGILPEETQGNGHTNGRKHTHTFIQTHRHKVQAQSHIQLHHGSHTRSHIYSGIRRQKQEQRQANKHPEEHQRQTGTTGTRRNTPGHGWNLFRYTPQLGAHSGAPGDTPTGGGGGEKAAPAHLAPPARPQVPAGAPSVRARACVPADARRHLWEERCALRPGRPGCAALGERLPWRAERGRILMERPRALPHCRPLRLPTLSSSFSEVTASRAPHSEGLSPLPEAWRLRDPPLPTLPPWKALAERDKVLGRCGAVSPGRRHQAGTAAGSAGATLEMGVSVLGGG